MSIVITPLTQPTAPQAATAAPLALQAGSIISARVQQVLTNNIVRIAIAGQSIDVLSQVPLQAGQTLQLAVSQTNDGTIRLAVVNPQDAASASQAAAQAANANLTADTVTLAPDAVASIAPQATTAPVTPNVQLTAQETLAVALATQTAATQQTSLAPLFANLAVASGLTGLPPQLQQAVAQLLAQRTSLDQNLTGNGIKQAFQSSGLFLEASLAAGSSPSAATPDLKAALIVLRQTLQTALGTSAAVTAPTASGAAQAVTQNASGAATLAPSAPELDAQETLSPQARLAVAGDLAQAVVAGRSALASALHAGPTAGATLNLLQEALQELGNPARAAVTLKDMRDGDVTVHTNTPPPPFRGSAPTPQPIASPSIAPDAPLSTTAHHLLDNTDAAIARQTLLQVASLPDRIEVRTGVEP